MYISCICGNALAHGVIGIAALDPHSTLYPHTPQPHNPSLSGGCAVLRALADSQIASRFPRCAWTHEPPVSQTHQFLSITHQPHWSLAWE